MLPSGQPNTDNKHLSSISSKLYQYEAIDRRMRENHKIESSVKTVLGFCFFESEQESKNSSKMQLFLTLFFFLT